MPKKLTRTEFLVRAKEKHGAKYDYSKVEFESVLDYVSIICPKHGEFRQQASEHARGRGCPKCACKWASLTFEEFVEESNKVHNNKYDYSLSEFIDAKTPVAIKCPRHGIFYQQPQSHMNGCGCEKCKRIDGRGLYLGVAINDVDEYLQKEKSYILWSGMVGRCYNEKNLQKRPTYRGCVVCDEWLIFSNFKRWFDEHYIEGYQLDKDILVKGNKVYSPDTCCFVPQEVNTLFTTCRKKRGKYPIGVSFINAKQKFIACVAIGGKNKTIGHFDSQEKAFEAYKIAKEAHIKEMADKWKDKLDPRAYEALINYKVEIED